MRISRHLTSLGSAAAFALLVASAPAVALTLQLTPMSIGQAAGANINLGHAVYANTPYNRLTAGGTYRVSCNRPETSALTGARTLSSETYGGPNVLYVTIPTVLPAQRALPGFQSVPYGTLLSCTYELSGRAVESGYSINLGGMTFQIGNGERSDSDTIPFTMVRGEEKERGCILD